MHASALIVLVVLSLFTGQEKNSNAGEPEWDTWKTVRVGQKARMKGHWDVLLKARPDRRYDDEIDEINMMQTVDAAYEALEANPRAAWAAGVEILQGTKDDFERLMVASFLHDLDPKKGDTFLLWAMANSKSVDILFEPLFEKACQFADKRDRKYLPAISLILRAREGKLYLDLHDWYIPTHECMFYVFGRYGKGAIPFLRQKLRDSDVYVRRNAAFALGPFGDQKSKPVYVAMVKNQAVDSAGAAFALGELGDRDAVDSIATLLRSSDRDLRFWAAYALFEIGSRGALAALEKALAREKDDGVRQEMDVAVKYVKSRPKFFGSGGRKMARDELENALAKSEKENGLRTSPEQAEAIAISANTKDLERLERIRLRTMQVWSDLGNQSFRLWSTVIKSVRKRKH